MIYDISVNCTWVASRWQQYSTHLHTNSTRSDTHADQYAFFFITSRSFLLRMRNVSDNNCRGKQKTHFVFSDFFSKIVPFVR